MTTTPAKKRLWPVHNLGDHPSMQPNEGLTGQQICLQEVSSPTQATVEALPNTAPATAMESKQVALSPPIAVTSHMDTNANKVQKIAFANTSDDTRNDNRATLSCCDADLNRRGKPCCMNEDDGNRGEDAVSVTSTAAEAGVKPKKVAFFFRVSPEVMRDIIIGLSDGLTVPFALTAGLSGTGSSRFVVLAGVAELVAGAISMGVGGYLSAKTEREHYFAVRKATHERVRASCSRELQNEVQSILDVYGVPDAISQALSDSLIRAESKQSNNQQQEEDEKKRDADTGLTPFLLHVGANMESIGRWRVYTSALTIGISYLLGGLVPLLPYFFCSRVNTALFISIAVTGFTLLVFGAVKQPLVDRMEGSVADATPKKDKNAFQHFLASWPWKDSLYGAVSTLAVGGAAAAASFGIVRAIETRTHGV